MTQYFYLILKVIFKKCYIILILYIEYWILHEYICIFFVMRKEGNLVSYEPSIKQMYFRMFIYFMIFTFSFIYIK